MIQINGTIQLKKDSKTHYEDIIGQIARDATYGTYKEFPEFFSSLLDNYDKYVDIKNVEPIEDKDDTFSFEIHISTDIFPIDEGGIQHFISSVSGDYFNMQTKDNDIKEIKISSINWEEINQNNKAENIQRIRNKFNLNELEPLMAFTFKPRFGLNTKDFIEISKGVFKEGFHIVEPDTRKILLNKEKYEFIAFAKRLEEHTHRKHKHAFSLNLSNRIDDIDEIITLLSEGNQSPVVIKIDGGLDGLSLMQKAKKTNSDCIITCYPLLKNQLNNKVPTDFLNQATVYCGADIMYPGGRANLSSNVRSYDIGETHGINNSLRKYKQYIDSGTFIPTIAGGITPGQLHLFYELYGPKISFFLGGAVALHNDGPSAGAKLCKKIIDEAVIYRQKNPTGMPEDISEKLIEEICKKYNGIEEKNCKDLENHDRIVYISPKVFFEENQHIRGYFKR